MAFQVYDGWIWEGTAEGCDEDLGDGGMELDKSWNVCRRELEII